MADQPSRTMTTESGAPISNNQNSLTAGPRGPMLMQDFALIEKMAAFNRERVPERVVHAKGYGAHGTFTVTHDISKFTRAKLFGKVGNTCPMLSRFSTVGGESGSADIARDPRGFSLKFYTEEGNWDMVGNNTPIFFIRDPLKFSDFIRTQKRDPGTHLKPHWRRWDYWGLSPEAIHQVMILYSDRGTPVSARFMHGYGSHTYSFWNAAGERTWVKFHFISQQGTKNVSDDEATQIMGANPDSSTEDFHNAIAKGDFPRWTMKVQLMPEKDAETYKWNPFDLTKVWPHSDYPLHEVGVVEMNRNVVNYFQEIEQAAYEPSAIVPGIGFSPDKVLQNRVLSYGDAHRYRMGVNYHQAPVNRPLAPLATYNRDGFGRMDGNGGGGVDYEPNSFGGPTQDPSFAEPPMRINGDADRYTTYPGDDADLYEQPRALWSKVLDDSGRKNLVTNIVASMSNPTMGMQDQAKLLEIQHRMLKHWFKVHPDMGSRIAEGLGVNPKQMAAE